MYKYKECTEKKNVTYFIEIYQYIADQQPQREKTERVRVLHTHEQ